MKCAFVDLGKHYGGMEVYLLTLAKNWIEQGNECVFVVRKGSVFEKKVCEEFSCCRIYGVFLSLHDAFRVCRDLKKQKIDFLHINGINSGVFCLLMNSNMPQITTVHSNADLDRAHQSIIVRKFFVVMEKLCLSQSKEIISVSHAMEKQLLKRGIPKSKITVIHNGIKHLEYLRKELRLNSCEQIKICYVGRLEKVKGCNYLLQALANLKDVNYCCDIYGEGSLKDELEELALNLGITNRVCFKGFSNTVRKELDKYDILIQPSLYESFPLTLIEAMNAKTEIVCSAVGGMVELIEDKKTGYLFDKGDTEELTRIICEIYHNPDKQITIVENAYQKYQSEYSETTMVQKTFEVFHKAVL